MVMREMGTQLDARAEGRQWMPAETFYDIAIVAALRTGNVARARALVDRMPSATERDAGDLRVRLLESHVRRAERAMARDASAAGAVQP